MTYKIHLFCQPQTPKGASNRHCESRIFGDEAILPNRNGYLIYYLFSKIASPSLAMTFGDFQSPFRGLGLINIMLP